MNKKLLYILKRYFTLDGYSIAPLGIQLSILIIISGMIIALFSIFSDSVLTSYLIFMDPTAIPDDENILVVSVEILFGIIIGSFIISILSSALENYIVGIKTGTLSYKKSNHIIFINKNKQLFYILSELNIKYSSINTIKEIVILLDKKESVEELLDNLPKYDNIVIYVKFGNLTDNRSYDRINIENAEAISILSSDHINSSFLNDNNNLKILTTILSYLKNKNDKTITIQIIDSEKVDKISTFLYQNYKLKNGTTICSKKFLSKILNRSIINIDYYKIYSELFTFDNSEIYIVEQNKFNLNGKNFKDIYISFENSLLLGIVRDRNVLLCPVDENIQEGDKLVIIADNEYIISYNNNLNYYSNHISIEQPSEYEHKKVCMLGNNISIDGLFDFLDDNSKSEFGEYVFEDANNYYDIDFLKSLSRQNFEIIIINLNDEQSYRLIMHILSIFGKNSKIVKSLVSIISDPKLAMLINDVLDRENVILSDRLAGQFASQLIFNVELNDVINELTKPEGYEFNIIDIENFKNKDLESIKTSLLSCKMLYIGTIYNERVIINNSKIENVKKIIVLSKGLS